jgi:hypothetical protein
VFLGRKRTGIGLPKAKKEILKEPALLVVALRGAKANENANVVEVAGLRKPAERTNAIGTIGVVAKKEAKKTERRVEGLA